MKHAGIKTEEQFGCEHLEKDGENNAYNEISNVLQFHHIQSPIRCKAQLNQESENQ